jgi:hypothetical protein
LIQAMLTNPHCKSKSKMAYTIWPHLPRPRNTPWSIWASRKSRRKIFIFNITMAYDVPASDEDLAKLKTNIASFIDGASK